MQINKKSLVLGLLRLSMGFIFLWAFLDKTFGLGFATKAENAWLAGGSPTTGFLSFAVHGPFANFFHSLAGIPIIDWLFMAGLLFVGVSFMLGIFMRLASMAGVAMLLLMFLALGLPPENNPLIDDHIIYAFVAIFLGLSGSAHNLGLGAWWERRAFVLKHKLLK